MPLLNPQPTTTTAATSSTPTTVSASTTSVSILAANPQRKGATIWNNSNNNLFIDFGATASAAAFTAKLFSQGYYELPFTYTGVISGIWDGTNGACFVRELV
jgi:hypothetical protein